LRTFPAAAAAAAAAAADLRDIRSGKSRGLFNHVRRRSRATRHVQRKTPKSTSKKASFEQQQISREFPGNRVQKSGTFSSRATSEQSYQTRPTKNAEINVEKASF
jgi:hypothetical protein